MKPEAVHRPQTRAELSEAESALIYLLRKGDTLHHQIIISCRQRSWCIEAADLNALNPPVVAYGNSFAEAWSRVVARIPRIHFPERYVNMGSAERKG